MPIEGPVYVPEKVTVGPIGLPGEWWLPAQALGIVIFSHSSGSRRQSARNRHVARLLHGYGLGTLLLDLLTAEESLHADKAWDIELLAQRLQEALLWLPACNAIASLPVGIFASNTGTAAALIVAARLPAHIRAIVSRSGRPDMADGFLAQVHAPTLLIVGAKDPYVLKVNRTCALSMPGVTELKVVPRATQLFEELGTLDVVANLAGDWFRTYFRPSGDVAIEEVLLRR